MRIGLAHLEARLHRCRSRKILGVRVEQDEMFPRDEAGEVCEVIHSVKAQPEASCCRQLVQFGGLSKDQDGDKAKTFKGNHTGA